MAEPSPSPAPGRGRPARHGALGSTGNEDGAAILEFALVLPILFALLAGCFEIGRALLIYQAMNEAVRGGARLLARIPDATCRPACTPGVAQAVAATQAALVRGARVAPELVRIVPVPDAVEGAVAMRAEVGLALDLGPAFGFDRILTLRAVHQEARVGE